MTKHSGPEYTAPDELRCEALVHGHPEYIFEWMKHDHRCPRKANQMRADMMVCWQHARMKRVEHFKVDTTDIPEVGAEWFKKARLRLP